MISKILFIITQIQIINVALKFCKLKIKHIIANE